MSVLFTHFIHFCYFFMVLGDLAPAYNDLILPTALIGCKSADELVRASSLANLGELCKLLRYSLGNSKYEVISNYHGVICIKSYM